MQKLFCMCAYHAHSFFRFVCSGARLFVLCVCIYAHHVVRSLCASARVFVHCVCILCTLFLLLSCEKAVLDDDSVVSGFPADKNLRVTVFSIEKTPFGTLTPGAYAPAKRAAPATRAATPASEACTRLNFAIYDDGAPGTPLLVTYDGGVSATFGDDITAICTGKLDAAGVLVCDELVTKCPSKYETATDALSVERLLGYGEAIQGKPLKLTGTVVDGSLKPASQGSERFVLADASDSTAIVIVDFDGALSDQVSDGSALVVSGSLGADGVFVASDVALEG